MNFRLRQTKCRSRKHHTKWTTTRLERPWHLIATAARRRRFRGPTVPGPRGSREVSLSVGAFAKLDDSGVSKWLHNHAAKFDSTRKRYRSFATRSWTAKLFYLSRTCSWSACFKRSAGSKSRRALASLPSSGEPGSSSSRPEAVTYGKVGAGTHGLCVDRRDKGVFESSMSSLPSLRSGFSDTTDANLRTHFKAAGVETAA